MASSLLLSGAVMTSCESMIEEKPFDFIVPEDVEDSDNGADMWVTGVYNTLHEAMFRYGSFPRPLDMVPRSRSAVSLHDFIVEEKLLSTADKTAFTL